MKVLRSQDISSVDIDSGTSLRWDLSVSRVLRFFLHTNAGIDYFEILSPNGFRCADSGSIALRVKDRVSPTGILHT